MTERTPWLVSALVNSCAGRPAIIVGGGPSAPAELKKIPRDERTVIISANGHAFKLKLQPNYIWCKDHLRIYPGYLHRGAPREYMERELRPHGVPIVGPNYWCDYRAIEWPLTQFNSGQQALAFAVMLGCAPIVPVGMDCFMGDTYFHDKDAPNISRGRKLGYWVSRLQKLRTALGGHTPIRGLSGLPLETFGAYRQDRPVAPIALPHVLARYSNMPTVRIRMLQELQDPRERYAIIPKGYLLASNRSEADRLCRLRAAKQVKETGA